MPVTKYVWDGTTDSYLMETDENDVTTAVYTNEPGRFGPVISQRRGGDSHFFHQDGLGSVVDVTDAAEAPTDSYVYKGYGEIVAATGSTTNPFRWVGSLGYYYDLDLPQYYIRARHYDPLLARFITRDPIGYEGGDENLYRYVLNRPVVQVDAFGTQGQAIPFVPRVVPSSVDLRGTCVHAVFTAYFALPPQIDNLQGYVIQEIQSKTKVYSCFGRDITFLFPRLQEKHFWEAFDVFAIRLRSRVSLVDDTFEFGFNARETFGYHEVTGTAKGRANWSLPSTFQVGTIPEAEELPATRAKPGGWDAIPGVPHNMRVEWNCCCLNLRRPSAKVETVPRLYPLLLSLEREPYEAQIPF